MKSLRSFFACSVLAATGLASAVLACGTPPGPPPPPPAPPVVCCRIVAWYQDPVCIGRQTIILCYYREDGLPLFVSNPMPLPASQQCGCAVSKLPNFPGVEDGGIAFGPVGDPAARCITFPQDVPGYGPFTTLCSPQTTQQIDSFFDIFTKAAGIPRDTSTNCPQQSNVFSFSGPGQIPAGVGFGLYRKVIIPAGFNPNLLCGFGLSAVGLFLIDNGVPFVEPPASGLPPIPFGQFAQNPGASAFYKVKCLPLDLPAPCAFPCVAPTPCLGDANNDGIVGFGDITTVLNFFGRICPP